MSDAVDLIQIATDYARRNLAECAADILAARSARDQYPAGKCAFVRATLAPIYGPYDRESEVIVERLELEHAASQGWRALAEVQPESGELVLAGCWVKQPGGILEYWSVWMEQAPVTGCDGENGDPATHWTRPPYPPVMNRNLTCPDCGKPGDTVSCARGGCPLGGDM